MIINYSISKRVLERIICCCSCPCVHNAPRHEWGLMATHPIQNVLWMELFLCSFCTVCSALVC